MSDYDNWSLEQLRDECQTRKIEFSLKDGVKTLSSKLRTNDKLLNVSGMVQCRQRVRMSNWGQKERFWSNQNYNLKL